MPPTFQRMLRLRFGRASVVVVRLLQLVRKQLPLRRQRHVDRLLCHAHVASHVTRHTSHVTRHTSHVTRHTSHVTRHTSHVTRHTSHVTRHTSHVTRHTSHVARHTSHVTRHTPCTTHHTSPAIHIKLLSFCGSMPKYRAKFAILRRRSFAGLPMLESSSGRGGGGGLEAGAGS
jgi:hypothetical protein